VRPTDRPLSCSNRGIEHVQRQLLNTTCPRSPSLSLSLSLPAVVPSPPSLSLSLSLSLSHLPLPVRSAPVSLCPSRSLSQWFLLFFTLGSIENGRSRNRDGERIEPAAAAGRAHEFAIRVL